MNETITHERQISCETLPSGLVDLLNGSVAELFEPDKFVRAGQDDRSRWRSELGRRVLRDFFLRYYDPQSGETFSSNTGLNQLASWYYAIWRAQGETHGVHLNPLQDVVIAVVVCCGQGRREVINQLTSLTGYSRPAIQNRAIWVTSLVARYLEGEGYEIEFSYPKIAQVWLGGIEQEVEVDVVTNHDLALRKLAIQETDKLYWQLLCAEATQAYAIEHPNKVNAVEIFLQKELKGVDIEILAGNLSISRTRVYRKISEGRAFFREFLVEEGDFCGSYAELFTDYFLYQILESMERIKEQIEGALDYRKCRIPKNKSFLLAKQIMRTSYIYFRMGKSVEEIRGIIWKIHGPNVGTHLPILMGPCLFFIKQELGRSASNR
jgi:hypothetical protein